MLRCIRILDFVWMALSRVTLSLVTALGITFASDAVEPAQKSNPTTQSQNDSQKSKAKSDDSLDDLLGESDKQTEPQSQSTSQPTSTKAREQPAQQSQSSPEPDAKKDVDGVHDANEHPEDALLPTIPVPVHDDVAIQQPKEKKKSSGQIEEIIVTATKREESLRNIPQSITAFSGDSLEKSAIQGADEIVKLSPGVNFSSDGQRAAHITIRGISSGQDQNQTTGVIFGNVSLSDPYLQLVTLDPNPFDLKSVEILKGPQGTLFGAGGFGGAIRYVPQPPEFGVWETKYFSQYTTIAEGNGGSAPIFGAATNIPLGTDNTLALRLVGIERRDPGYIDDTGRGLKNINTLKERGLRGMLGWQPSSAWDIKLLYAYQTMSAPDIGFTDNTNGRLSRSDTPTASPTKNKFQLGNVSISYAFDWATATSETAVIKKNVDFFQDETRLINPSGVLNTLNLTGLQLSVLNDTSIVTQELRLTSPTDSESPWKWAAGIFGSKENYLANINLPTGSPLPIAIPLPVGLLTPTGQVSAGNINVNAKVEELALFGDVTRHFWDDWDFSVGARFYRTSSGGTAESTGPLFTGTTPINQTVVEKGISPKISLTWHATDEIMTYATVSRGYRVGGVQPGIITVVAQDDAPKFFKSDTLMNYELGVRTQWFDNSLHVDLTGYYLDWKNPQTRVYDPKDGVSNYFTNVGGVTGKGVESSVEWLTPIDGLSINIGVSYNKTVTNIPFQISSSQTVASGTPFPQSPEWQTATTLAYSPDFGDWKPKASVSHTYLSMASSDLINHFPIFNYQQWDVNFAIANPSLPWLPDFSLIGTNILDKRGIVIRNGTVDGGTSTANYTDVSYIRPRAITLRLSGKF